MKSLFIKDKNRRSSFQILEKKCLVLKYILNNLNNTNSVRTFAYFELRNLLIKNSITKIRNRCILTNRARAVYRKFKISRLFFKKYALQGELMGVKKAS
jgi:ribosomal protein S14